MRIFTVKLVFAATVPVFFGKRNFEDGIAALDGMEPIGAGLHEPPVTWAPFVRGRLTVLQKLMKLLVDVSDATCPGNARVVRNHSTGTCAYFCSHCVPAVGTSWPLLANPLAITAGSRARKGVSWLNTSESDVGTIETHSTKFVNRPTSPISRRNSRSQSNHALTVAEPAEAVVLAGAAVFVVADVLFVAVCVFDLLVCDFVDVLALVVAAGASLTASCAPVYRIMSDFVSRQPC